MSEANNDTNTESQSPAAAAPADPYAAMSVRSLVVPLNGLAMLIPNTAVAEVADYKVPQPVLDSPGWLLGMMLWRGRSIPLLAFEQYLGRSTGVGGVHARAIVCNTLNGNRLLPFVAILAQGIPRLQEIKGEMLELADRDGSSATPAAAALVRLGGQEAVIPDLDVVERMLLQLGIKGG